MGAPGWLLDLDQAHSSLAVLVALATLVGLAAGLYYLGVIGWLLRLLARLIRGTVRAGFRAWEALLAWAEWPIFLVISLALMLLGWVVVGTVPGLTVVCALVPVSMGLAACLAYMFIDVERYEVERGYKALHNPALGQALARHLVRYGHQVGVPLLAAAAFALIGGFALLNQGLYETVGRHWYQLEEDQKGAGFTDFLAYALLNLLRVVDFLDLAEHRKYLHVAHVKAALWPASTMLIAFKSLFTLVLLQQIFASVRQGRLLAETIADFWSPHPPIHDRAETALPQFGARAVGPLLVSLRSVGSLTKEQRDQIPAVVATIGPATIPTLLYYLDDPDEHVRAVAAGALGRLHTADAMPLLARLAADDSDVARQSAIEAIGRIAGAGTRPPTRRRRRVLPRPPGGGPRWLPWRRSAVPPPVTDPVGLAVTTLQTALADKSAAVRTQAAQALGGIGAPAAPAAAALTALLNDGDETVRCEAAEALGRVGGPAETTVPALVALLENASAPVKTSAARALGELKEAASPAVSALVPLLQDREEGVRTAVAKAIGQIGLPEGVATDTLLEGLASLDNVVRAQTAEALGTIGAAAQEAAPALVEALADSNDLVRAKAVEALGKIGESAAEVAVPRLMRALRDHDNWVSALAAEALGQMGEAADEAVPALIRSLKHLNPQVRANAAEALGRMGSGAAPARPALEKAGGDDDGGVRGQAVRALGALGEPAPSSEQVVRAALRDADPVVRAAAAEALGRWGQAGEETVAGLQALLEDPSDLVKVQAVQVLPRLAGPTPEVIDGLCRCLREDDNAWVQTHAAGALGRLGSAAVAAGPSLLHAAQTGAEDVRDQALRALAMIQPPEAAAAFQSGLQDPSADIRKVASGGWMKAEAIPDEAVPALVEALRDPEGQVRANAAHALARLEALPPEAVPLLIACTHEASDSLRMNAALALRGASADAVGDLWPTLLEDTNVRVRLLAAAALLAVPDHERAAAVVREALADPSPRVRRAALELIDSLGDGAAAFRPDVLKRQELEDDSDLRDILKRLNERGSRSPEVDLGERGALAP